MPASLRRVHPSIRRALAVGAAAAATAALALAQPAVGGAVHRAAATPVNRFEVLPLVSDQPGHAQTTDPDLVNAWGLAFAPNSPLWVANNGTSTSTLYQDATMPGQPVTKVPLTVKIPGEGSPTGTIFNPTSGFRLHTGGKSGPALFIFAGEDGELSAWNPTGDVTSAVLVSSDEGSVYKGLTMVRMGRRPFLLVANFHDDEIEIYNRNFGEVTRPNAFRAHNLPAGYAPFDVATLDGLVYVTYALQDADGEDDVPGPGHGFVNVFTQSGRFVGSLVRRGVLNSPWGLAIAPAGFGPYAGKLLVGNFGDGRIHVVDPRSGHVVATLRDTSGRPVVIDGLWGLLPGNGTAGGTSDVWFSAGPDDEAHGLLGILRP